ncbi:hypothetical protein BDQ17DRAFT_1429436 [Cyathus striatus]|nr:hypothetical protein BDQ17DRAFT_1429436 [Cyathus striatus]
MSAAGISVPFLTSEFGLDQIQNSYETLLPCFTSLLSSVLTAKNDYERKKNTEKIDKDVMAVPVVVTIISMCIFFRNLATNAFQIVMGLFLSSSGVGWHAIDIFNHMGISVSYQTVQHSLDYLTVDAKKRA